LRSGLHSLGGRDGRLRRLGIREQFVEDWQIEAQRKIDVAVFHRRGIARRNELNAGQSERGQGHACSLGG
jgi:hypothetical protein